MIVKVMYRIVGICLKSFDYSIEVCNFYIFYVVYILVIIVKVYLEIMGFVSILKKK